MADVSGILAAGRLNAAPDPFAQAKSFVDLNNQIQYGQNLQQNLANMQLQNQTGQQALADKRSTAMAQRLFAIQALPDDQVAGQSQRILDDALQSGLIDQNHYDIGKRIIGTGNVGNIRQYATLGLVGNLAGPEALKAVVPQQSVVDTGGALTAVTHPSPTQMLANPSSQPSYGSSVNKTISPETQAGQQGRPATQADIDEIDAANGPGSAERAGIRVGTTIQQTTKDRLVQQGHPELLPGGARGNPPAAGSGGSPPAQPQGGGGTGGGTSTQPATGGGTGNTATSSNGQPVSPQNPPRLQPAGPRPGTPVATSQPPNAAEEQKLSGDLFGREQTAAADFATRDQQQSAAVTALRSAKTGPGSDWVNHVKSFALSMAPEFSKAIGIDPNSIADYDTAKKYLTALAMAQPGAAGSDMRTTLSQLSNPSTEISNAAATHIMSTIQGLSRMRQAAFQDFLTKNTVEGTGGDTGIPAQTKPGASVNFGRHISDFSKNYDYRAFMPFESAEQYAKVVQSLKTQQDKDRFGRSVALARENGWIN